MIHASYLCLMCRLYDPKSILNFCLCMPSMMSCTHFILAKHPRAVCEVNAVSKKRHAQTHACTVPCLKVYISQESHPKVGKMRFIFSIGWDMHGSLGLVNHHNSTVQEAHPVPAVNPPVPVVLLGAAPGSLEWLGWNPSTKRLSIRDSRGNPTTCCEYVPKSHVFLPGRCSEVGIYQRLRGIPR